MSNKSNVRAEPKILERSFNSFASIKRILPKKTWRMRRTFQLIIFGASSEASAFLRSGSQMT